MKLAAASDADAPASQECFKLRALLYSVRPQLIEKGDLFEDTWGTLAALKTQAASNWCARSRSAALHAARAQPLAAGRA